MPDDDEIGLKRHVSDLATVAGQQAVIMTTMAEQIRALFALNAAFIGVFSNQVDIELVRANALKAFTDEGIDANSVALINSMLGPVKANETSSSDESMRDPLQEIERSRFTVIDGGRPVDGAG